MRPSAYSKHWNTFCWVTCLQSTRAKPIWANPKSGLQFVFSPQIVFSRRILVVSCHPSGEGNNVPGYCLLYLTIGFREMLQVKLGVRGRPTSVNSTTGNPVLPVVPIMALASRLTEPLVVDLDCVVIGAGSSRGHCFLPRCPETLSYKGPLNGWVSSCSCRHPSD